MKKVAVLMPTYNCANYLRESIDSILNQTFSNFDFYIYDDCSTDNSQEIIESYNDERIFFRKNTINLGISKTLNKGLDELLKNYEFIARMDADDWAYPERLEKQIYFLQQNETSVLCGTQGYWLKDLSEPTSLAWKYPIHNNYIRLYLLFAASFGHSSLLLRSDFFSNNQLRYDDAIKTCEDWDLWVRVAKIAKIDNLPDFLMKYRIVSTSNHRFSENKKMHFRERSLIISNYWRAFNINLSPEEVFEYYYDTNLIFDRKFNSKLKTLISCFNKLFQSCNNDLVDLDKRDFSYLLARKINDFTKRSKINRYSPVFWFIILTKVKFISTVRLIKSQIV